MIEGVDYKPLILCTGAFDGGISASPSTVRALKR
jgi:hypothetical protein